MNTGLHIRVTEFDHYYFILSPMQIANLRDQGVQEGEEKEHGSIEFITCIREMNAFLSLCEGMDMDRFDLMFSQVLF